MLESATNSSKSSGQKLSSDKQDGQTRPKLYTTSLRVWSINVRGAFKGWGMSESRFYSVAVVACYTLPCLFDHPHLRQTYITFIVENHSLVLRCASPCPWDKLISSSSSDLVSFQSTSFCQYAISSLLTFYFSPLSLIIRHSFLSSRSSFGFVCPSAILRIFSVDCKMILSPPVLNRTQCSSLCKCWSTLALISESFLWLRQQHAAAALCFFGRPSFVR